MEMEVICISSDDELDLQKQNKTDKILTNSMKTCSRVLVPQKTETLFSNDEKVEVNSLKRRKSRTDEDKITLNSMEKKKKLNFNTSEVISKALLCFTRVPETSSVKSDCNIKQLNKNQKIVNEKIQLIVKEKKKISYISQDVFPLFISLCLQKCPKDDKTDMDKIVDKLKRRFENLDPIYARSEDFVTFLNEKRKAILSNNKKIYVHIEEVMNQMKKKIKKSQPLHNNETYDAIPSTSYATNNVSVNNRIESNDDNKDDDNNNNEDDDEENISRTKIKIKKVLKTMKKCGAVIKKLEEEEVDFNEENDSNYLKVERYKQKMVELYNKFCELTGENTDAGRAYLRPKHLNVTRIIAVDQAITNFINSKIIRRDKMKKTGTLTDDLIFPNYRDILACVTRCNETKNLGLNEAQRKQMAEKAFKELGEHLQRTRRNDYWDTFSLYLENTEDPATKDKNLAKKLADNRIEGEKRLAAVFQKYVQKEKEMKIQNNDKTASEEEEEASEEEEEEEEEDDDDDDDDDDKDEEESINDKNDENLFISENGSEEDVDETVVKENRLLVEKNKSNIRMINMYYPIDKTTSNETVTDIVQQKCNETIKTKVLEKSDTAVSKNKNRIINKKIIYKSCNSNTIPKNIVKNVKDTNTQEDSPADSTTNCTKDLAKVETIKVSEVIIDPATKKVSKDITITGITPELIAGGATELITGDPAELITRDGAELITGDTAELITGDITENTAKVITENTAKVITENTEVTMEEIITENVIDGAVVNMPNDEELEKKKKPVLRLRSFAKPPTTWEDNQQKINKTTQENTPKIVNQTKDIVDLTSEETAKPSPVIAKCAIVGDKTVPVVKRQTMVIPSNRNIISVQNITNNYLKVNTRTGQIIAPIRDIRGPTVIRVPIQSTNRQGQNANTIIVNNDVPLKGKEILRIIPKKSFIISKKPIVQSVSKQTDAGSSTTKSK